MEHWVDIKNYSDYKISNFGRVKSIKYGKERILKQQKQWNGYWVVPVRELINGKTKKKILKIHRLVAAAFVPNDDVENKNVIDHINKNREDNSIQNLRWVTYSQNNQHKMKQCNNTSGVSGVGWDKRSKKWVVRIMVEGIHKNLGLFEDKEDAINVRKQAEEDYFGEFKP